MSKEACRVKKKNLIMDLSPNVGAILEMKVDVYPRIF